MTIYRGQNGEQYVLLEEVAQPERVLLEVFLVGMERPSVDGAVFLSDFLSFKNQQKELNRKRAQ